MTDYFRNFPKIDYKFKDGTTQKLVDLNIKFKLSEITRMSSQAYYPYSWSDGERADTLADKYYDNSSFYWLVLLSNGIFDVNHELPMNDTIFIKYLINKYKSESDGDSEKDVLDYCSSTIHHYEDSDGFWIDFESFQTVGNTTSVTIYDYELDINEKKRQVELISNTVSGKVKAEFQEKLAQLKAETE